MPIPFAGIGAAVGLVSSGIQFFQAQKEKKDAEEALNNLRRQELVNNQRDIKISTERTDRLLDSSLSSNANTIDATRRLGARGILGAFPSISDGNILTRNTILENVEEQDVNRSFAIAQGEDRIQSIREQRELGAIMGLGQQRQVGRQDSVSALGGFTNSLLAGGRSIDIANGTEIDPNPLTINGTRVGDGVDGRTGRNF
jgi:hypothetical protein